MRLRDQPAPARDLADRIITALETQGEAFKGRNGSDVMESVLTPAEIDKLWPVLRARAAYLVAKNDTEDKALEKHIFVMGGFLDGLLIGMRLNDEWPQPLPPPFGADDENRKEPA